MPELERHGERDRGSGKRDDALRRASKQGGWRRAGPKDEKPERRATRTGSRRRQAAFPARAARALGETDRSIVEANGPAKHRFYRRLFRRRRAAAPGDGNLPDEAVRSAPCDWRPGAGA